MPWNNESVAEKNTRLDNDQQKIRIAEKIASGYDVWKEERIQFREALIKEGPASLLEKFDTLFTNQEIDDIIDEFRKDPKPPREEIQPITILGWIVGFFVCATILVKIL